MRLCALMMVKDEADIIETTIRHLFGHDVDRVYVADNLSTDGTREILDRLALDFDVVVETDPEVGYYQSDKMTRMARGAWDHGFDWAIPCDADEVWTSRFGVSVRGVIERAHWARAGVVHAVLRDHFVTRRDPHYPATTQDPTVRMQWCNPNPGALPKVAVYLDDVTILQGNHGATRNGRALEPHDEILTIRHFPYRSPEQFVRKARNGAAAYAATDLPDDQGGHWRMYGQMLEEHGEAVTREWYYTHFVFDDPTERLVWDPAPVIR